MDRKKVSSGTDNDGSHGSKETPSHVQPAGKPENITMFEKMPLAPPFRNISPLAMRLKGSESNQTVANQPTVSPYNAEASMIDREQKPFPIGKDVPFSSSSLYGSGPPRSSVLKDQLKKDNYPKAQKVKPDLQLKDTGKKSAPKSDANKSASSNGDPSP
jgi:hypothetical protein